MHALRRHFCLILIILAGVDGARIIWREFLAQADRLGQVLGLGPAVAFPGCPNPFCDYTLYWLVGRLSAQSGAAAVYHPARAIAGAAQILPNQAHYLPFMYPPPMLPLAFLMSIPPLAISYYAFEILSVTAAILLLRHARISWFCIAAGLLGPAALWCLYLGQLGIICGALLVAGLAQLETNPPLAGGLLAMLCIKPQYGLLAPVLLLSRGDRSTWVAAAATLIFLAVLSLLCFGWSSWTAFLGPDRGQIQGWLQRPFGSDELLGTSVFWMARSFGATLSISYAVQLFCSTAAVLFAWTLWRREDIARDHRVAITICLCLLASPYSYNEDMVAYSIACALLIRRAPAITDALLALLWLAPGYVGHFGAKFGILPTPFCIAAVAFIGWRRTASETNPASPEIAGRRSAPVLSLSPTPSHPFR
jgi:hypothetical protein